MARVHGAADDATRLACVEARGDGRRNTTMAFLLCALRCFRDQGIRAERVMTDNASADRSRRCSKAPRRLGIRHLVTRPCSPKTDGKAERFIRTLLRAWAFRPRHRNAKAGNDDLPRWLDGFDGSGPQSAPGGLAPVERAHDLTGHHG